MASSIICSRNSLISLSVLLICVSNSLFCIATSITVSSSIPALGKLEGGTQLEVYGAGFDGFDAAQLSDLTCRFYSSSVGFILYTTANVLTSTTINCSTPAISSYLTSSDHSLTLILSLSAQGQLFGALDFSYYDINYVRILGAGPLKTNTYVAGDIVFSGFAFPETSDAACFYGGSKYSATVVNATFATCTLPLIEADPRVQASEQAILTFSVTGQAEEILNTSLGAPTSLKFSYTMEFPPLISADFDSTYSRLYFTWAYPVFPRPDNCSEIWNSASMNKIGFSSICQWTSDTSLTITLRGEGVSIQASDSVRMLSGTFYRESAMYFDTCEEPFQIGDFLVPPIPVVSLSAPSVISKCLEKLWVEVLGLSGIGYGPLSHTWSVKIFNSSMNFLSPGEYTSADSSLESYLGTYASAANILEIPTLFLTENRYYTFSTNSTNVFGVQSSASFTILVVSFPVPILSIDGGTLATFPSHLARLRFGALLDFPTSCYNSELISSALGTTTSVESIDYSWVVTDGHQSPLPLQSDWSHGNTLVLPSSEVFVETNAAYAVQLTATLTITNSVSSNQNFTFQFPISSFQIFSLVSSNRLSIFGGDRLVGQDATVTLTALNPLGPQEDFSYTWNCMSNNPNSGFSCPSGVDASNETSVSFSVSLSDESYAVSLFVQDLQTFSSAQSKTWISVLPVSQSQIPEVMIRAPSSTFLASQEILTLTGFVHSPVVGQAYWSCVQEEGFSFLQLTASNAQSVLSWNILESSNIPSGSNNSIHVGKASQINLVLYSGVLTPGVRYKFRLTAIASSLPLSPVYAEVHIQTSGQPLSNLLPGDSFKLTSPDASLDQLKALESKVAFNFKGYSPSETGASIMYCLEVAEKLRSDRFYTLSSCQIQSSFFSVLPLGDYLVRGRVISFFGDSAQMVTLTVNHEISVNQTSESVNATTMLTKALVIYNLAHDFSNLVDALILSLLHLKSVFSTLPSGSPDRAVPDELFSAISSLMTGLEASSNPEGFTEVMLRILGDVFDLVSNADFLLSESQQAALGSWVTVLVSRIPAISSVNVAERIFQLYERILTLKDLSSPSERTSTVSDNVMNLRSTSERLGVLLCGLAFYGGNDLSISSPILGSIRVSKNPSSSVVSSSCSSSNSGSTYCVATDLGDQVRARFAPNATCMEQLLSNPTLSPDGCAGGYCSIVVKLNGDVNEANRSVIPATLRSSIASIDIFNQASNSYEAISDLSTPLTLTFSFPSLSLVFSGSSLQCRFWDATNYDWSQEGCSMVQSWEVSGTTNVKCACTHATQFAVFESCPAGYYGDNCTFICPLGTYGVDCASSKTCSNHGFPHHVSGECNCTSYGFTGSDCQLNCTAAYNQGYLGTQSWGVNCSSTCDCQHGAYCDPFSGACTCTPGWTGADCATDVLECASNPCYNGGTCVEKTNSFGCTCAAGFNGTRCENNIDECVGNSCVWGQCVDGVNGYQCLCNPGVEGTLCNQYCTNNKYGQNCSNTCACSSNSICNAASGNCTCFAGYYGALCFETSSAKDSTLLIVLCVIFITLFLLILIYFLYRRQKKQNKISALNNDPFTDQGEHSTVNLLGLLQEANTNSPPSQKLFSSSAEKIELTQEGVLSEPPIFQEPNESSIPVETVIDMHLESNLETTTSHDLSKVDVGSPGVISPLKEAEKPLPVAAPPPTDPSRLKIIIYETVEDHLSVKSDMIIPISDPEKLKLLMEEFRPSIRAACNPLADGLFFFLVEESKELCSQVKETSIRLEEIIFVSSDNLNTINVLKAVHSPKTRLEFCICGKRAKFECSKCGLQAYCDSECQRQDWKIHAAECKRRSMELHGAPDTSEPQLHTFADRRRLSPITMVTAMNNSTAPADTEANSLDVCANCKGPGSMVCSRCKKVSYCSPECQISNWRAHKPDCQPSHGTSNRGRRSRSSANTLSPIPSDVPRSEDERSESPKPESRSPLPPIIAEPARPAPSTPQPLKAISEAENEDETV